MGLLTAYLAYRAGKKSAIRAEQRRRFYDSCALCGFPEEAHSQDGRLLCPPIEYCDHIYDSYCGNCGIDSDLHNV